MILPISVAILSSISEPIINLLTGICAQRSEQ